MSVPNQTKRLKAFVGCLLTMIQLFNVGKAYSIGLEPKILAMGGDGEDGGGGDDPVVPEGSGPDGSDPKESDAPEPLPLPLPQVGFDIDTGKTIGEYQTLDSDPSKVIVVFNQDESLKLIDQMAQGYDFNQAMLEQWKASVKNNETVFFADVTWNPDTKVFDVSGELKVRPADPSADRANVFAANDAFISGPAAFQYQQGAKGPDVSTDKPAVDRGPNEAGESLLPSTGNQQVAPSDRDGGKSNTNTPGLPGPGSAAKTTDDDRKDPVTWVDYANKLDHYLSDMTEVVAKSQQAFSDDLAREERTMKDAGRLVHGRIGEGRAKHNEKLKDLNRWLSDAHSQAVNIPQDPAKSPQRGSAADPDAVGGYQFQTLRSSEAGQKLESARRYLDAVSAEVKARPNANQQQREALVRAADLSIHIADRYFNVGDAENAKEVLDKGLRCLDIAIDLTPGIAFAKIGFTVITGINPITGDKVGAPMRAILAATLFMPSLLSGASSTAIKLSVLLRGLATEESGVLSELATELESTVAEADSGIGNEGGVKSNPALEQEAVEEFVANAVKAPPISTPYGDAVQSKAPEAIVARHQVQNGATLYRVGTTGRSDTIGAQFWALESPTSPGYAVRYGIPPENIAKQDFIETAVLKKGSAFVTRQAPPVGSNPGGGIEVVVPKDGVTLESHSSL